MENESTQRSGLIYVFRELCNTHQAPVSPAVVIVNASKSHHVKYCMAGNHIAAEAEIELEELEIEADDE